MALDTAKKFIDYVLTTDDIRRCESVILEFIGGEPLLEPELIESICDYFKIRSYEEKCSWYWNYRISIGTNGVNYDDERVQRLIHKNKGKISVSIMNFPAVRSRGLPSAERLSMTQILFLPMNRPEILTPSLVRL